MKTTTFTVAVLSAVLASFGVSLVSSSASAAHRNSKKKASHQPEVYSAVEDEGDSDGIVLAATATPAGTSTAAAQQRIESARNPVRAEIATEPVVAPAFDPVPSDQADPLLHRLQLVEGLLRKFHRAYDYRTLTIRQLEAVQAQLEAGEKPPAPPAAAKAQSASGDSQI